MKTNEILLHALGPLWPDGEPKPSFRHHSGLEWECYHDTAGVCCPTLEEALYRYAHLSNKYDDRFGAVLDFLGQYVDDPIID